VQSELFGELQAPVQRVAAAFTPVPFARSLELAALPTAEKISSAIRSTVKT
jgi:acetoin:2,6-dichlorophenolindophenol oxidoreductase subunit beta